MDYDKLYEQKCKENELYFDIFLRELKEQKLSEKVIKRHMSYARFFVNDYLNFREITDMKEGTCKAYDFLMYFLPYKCLWTSKNTCQNIVATVSKFYKIMVKYNFVDKVEVKNFIDELRMYKVECLRIINNEEI